MKKKSRLPNKKFEQALNENLGLVRSLSLKFKPRPFERAEYYQVALIGFWRAWKTYDDNKGRFSNWAYICILNKLRNMMRDKKQFVTGLDLDLIAKDFYFDYELMCLNTEDKN